MNGSNDNTPPPTHRAIFTPVEIGAVTVDEYGDIDHLRMRRSTDHLPESSGLLTLIRLDTDRSDARSPSEPERER